MQKKYWSDNHHRIGYGINHANESSGTRGRDSSPYHTIHKGPSPCQSVRKSKYLQRQKDADRSYSGEINKNMKSSMPSPEMSNYADPKRNLSSRIMSNERSEESARTIRSKISVLHGLSHTSDDDDNTEIAGTTSRLTSILRTHKKYFHNESTCLPSTSPSGVKQSERIATAQQLKVASVTSNDDEQSIVDNEAVIKQLNENSSLKESILMVKESSSRELYIEREKNISLIERNEDLKKRLETAKEEQEALMDIFAEERRRRDQGEVNLKNKLKESASTIQDLLEQLTAARNCRRL